MANASNFMPKGLKNVLKKVQHCLRTRRSPKSHGSLITASTAPLRTNTLSGLSAEINQAIFSMLPDLTSLRALMLTCSSLYHCFLDAESLILAKVIENEIPRSLLSDAFATLKSSEMTPWNQQTADNFRNLFTTFENPPLPPKWSLRTATALSDMHGHVEFFANRFVSTTFSQNPVTGHPQPEYIKASPKELVRIKRAFYRFEFYCNLLAFQRKCDGGCSNVFATNFSKYAPWENEQLACIREHLVEAVSDGRLCLLYETQLLQKTDPFSSQKLTRHQRQAHHSPLPPRLERQPSLVLPSARSQVPTSIRCRRLIQRALPWLTQSIIELRILLHLPVKHH